MFLMLLRVAVTVDFESGARRRQSTANTSRWNRRPRRRFGRLDHFAAAGGAASMAGLAAGV